MASLHTASIGKVASMPGQHGSSSGAVEITGVRVFHHDPNDAVSKTHVIVRVKNVGNSPTGFELFQTWVE